MTRDDVDLSGVWPAHADIHERLENWARWCRSGSGGTSTLPMFRHYRSGYQETPQIVVPIDSMDGQRVEKLVIQLPEKHRLVLQWAYVRPYIPPRVVCRALAITHAALCELLHTARSMAKNRACACEHASL